MFLRQNFDKRTGRVYLSIIQGYRDSEGKPKQKTVRGIGYLDELNKEYEDPVAYFTQVAEEMNKERKVNMAATVTLNKSAQLERGAVNRKNYGYVVFSKIYHELEIDWFLKNARRHENLGFNTDAIMQLFVYASLLSLGTKKPPVADKDIFFDNFTFPPDDISGALAHFSKVSEELQWHLNRDVTKQYKKKIDSVYSDITHYYFEKERKRPDVGQIELMPDNAGEHFTDIYRGLRHIEESFKTAKSAHGARHFHLHSHEHTSAFLLICFISLLIAGIAELRLKGKYTITEITEALRRVSCSKIDQNLWLFDFANAATDDMNAAFGTDFGRKIMTLDEIKKSLGSAKKAAHH